MPIREAIDSRAVSKDANGQKAGARTFLSIGVPNPAAALAEFDALADARVHPDDAGLVFDRVDCRGQNGNTVYVVTATYTTFRGGRRPTEPQATADNPVFGWDYQKVTVEIPVAYQQTITTRSGDRSVTAIVWDAKTVKVAERRIVRSLRVAFETDNSSTLDIIADQDRKLHTIRGREYLFLGASVSQDSKDQRRYLIEYTWELDRGTIIRNTPSTLIIFPDAPIPAPGTGGRLMYILAPADAVVLPSTSVRLRTPYHTLDAIAAADARTPPEAVQILAYDSDPEGWRGLPGMVPL